MQGAIRFLIQIAEPVDEANYRIVIKGKADKWEGSRPRIYQFLRDFVTSGLNRAEKLKEAGIDKPLGFNELASKV